jgi:hypothetical protein
MPLIAAKNESVARWNAIVQRMNMGTEYKLMLRDSFEEVDDPNGHLKKMLTKAVLNKFLEKWSSQSRAYIENG